MTNAFLSLAFQEKFMTSALKKDAAKQKKFFKYVGSSAITSTLVLLTSK